MKIKIIFILLLVSIPILQTNAQPKYLLEKFDFQYSPPVKYFIDEVDLKSNLNKTFNPYAVDTALVNTAVLWEINQLRKEKELLELQFSFPLYKTAFNYLKINSIRRFENKKKNKKKLSKSLTEICRLFGFKGRLINLNIDIAYAINYNGKEKFYYDANDTTTKSRLFYGDKKNKRVIPNLTYQQVAKRIAKKFWNKLSKSKIYDYAACFCQIERTTLFRKKIPQLKCLMLLGGYRLKFLIEEDKINE